MNKSFKISDKSLHVALIVGSCLLALVILALSIAVTVQNRREKNVLPSPSGSLLQSATDPLAPTDVTPGVPTIDEMIFVLPVEGGLLNVHDLATLAYSVTMQDYRVHTGIDIETADGAAVLACANGSVAEISADSLMGNTIVIDHGNGVRSIYRNLGDTLPEGITVGATVKAGQLIGAVGNSAIVEVGENSHLHFELTENGAQVDPVLYLDYAPLSEVTED